MMTPRMEKLLQSAIGKFRRAYPHMQRWTDQQVIEALFLEASKQPGSGIRVIGEYRNGELRFEIKLRPDASDGSR